MSIATTNIIPYLLIKFEETEFQWLNHNQFIGKLNGRKVEVRPLPIWVIFLLKTLPLMLLILAVSNNFFLIQEFFKLEHGMGIAVVTGISLFGAIFSLFLSKGGLRIITAIFSLLLYMLVTYVCLKNGGLSWAFQVGAGATLYMIFILYAWWDIVMIMLNQKQMFYVVNQTKVFSFWRKNRKNQKRGMFSLQLEGIFLNLYSDQRYEVQNEDNY